MRKEGKRFGTICAELDLGDSLLRGWMRQHPETYTFRQVEIQAAPEAASSGLSIVLPSGLRIEGLDVSAVVLLAERLS